MCLYDILYYMKKQQKLNKKQKKFWRKYPELLISVFVFLVVGFISRIGWLDILELKAYDVLLSVKPDTEERSDIVIAAIDDAAIAVEGTFPWPRDVLADAIIRMRELGAEQVSFDIEYLSESVRGLNTKGYYEELPETLASAEEDISAIFYDFSDVIASGQLPIEYVGEVTQDLIVDGLVPAFDLLESEIQTEVSRDNDLYFAQALHFFGNSWLTINAGNVGLAITNKDYERYVREELLLSNITEPGENVIAEENYRSLRDHADPLDEKDLLEAMENDSRVQPVRQMTPAIEKLMKASDGAGFTNIILDSDGTRRRVELLHETEGKYIAQLVFAPLLYTFDSDTLERTNNSLIVKDVLYPGEETRRDITIPLDSDGRFLVNWISDTFQESFKNESVLFLHNIDEMEESLIGYLTSIASFRLGTSQGFLSYYDAANYLLSFYDDLTATKKMLMEDMSVENTRNDPRYDDYLTRRAEFFDFCSELKNPYYQDEIFALLDSIVTEENMVEMALLKEDISEKFDGFETQLDLYNELFASLKSVYDGSFVIVGHTASNSTDLGTTPFEGKYPNVGTHANIYNTIMNEDFILPMPRIFTILFSLFLLVCYAITASKVNTGARHVLGVITILSVPIVGVVSIYFNVYIALVSTLFCVIFAYVGILLWYFATSESDKKLLRQSFETYLSDDVVEEIVASGVKPELGGEERNVTALFSDIKAFSSFSEQLSATQLVDILNNYLTALSDEILDQRGTIDKYIGDAIVAIFGAPIPMEDHAWRACVSAIRMKQAEELVNADLKEINEQLVADGKSPIEIKTRIGLNTGDIVVGNMGTQKKMNYTMMGDDVNLAARLEGVNKSYNSWILVSETTWEAANSGSHAGELLARRLDKVRVVGRTTPVQLYNIVGIKGELSKEQIECVDIFHKGLDLYLEKKFSEAKKVFKEALKVYAHDGPSEAFVARCEEFIKKGVPENWSGILNMTSK